MRRYNHALAVFIILVATAWFVILFTSQTHVHSDEAIIGLMGKHILQGRYLPFYMYGQSYNSGAAWEAYLAAIAFALFGVSAISLKGCIVVLSVLCLFLFYRMCLALYDPQTSLLATISFALAPSLLKWHFQVRGYSWYFLSIPVLTMLFASIESARDANRKTAFFFGLASGIGIWCLELVLPLVGVLWTLLILRRRLSVTTAAVALLGFITGYASVIAFNFTHHFANWRYVFIEKPGGGFSSLFHLSAFTRIFLDEMPKFFGPDTILWYYPEKPPIGYLFYGIAILATGFAIWPFAASPSKIVRALRGDLSDQSQTRDFDMLMLTAAAFVPYLTQSVGVPSYFFGGCFFLSVLTGRMLRRLFSSSQSLPRLAGAGVLAAILAGGVAVMIRAAGKNQIETLCLCQEGKNYCMTRIPGADMEEVEQYLRQHNVTSVWTTISFVYPFLFESGEVPAVSNAIFEYPHRVYPSKIPWREPNLDPDAAFIIETDSPFRRQLEGHFTQAFGRVPSVKEFGKLTLVAKQD